MIEKKPSEIQVCEYCQKEPIVCAIIDTYSVPRWKSYIQYVGLKCLIRAMKLKEEDDYFKYAPYWLVLRHAKKSKLFEIIT